MHMICIGPYDKRICYINTTKENAINRYLKETGGYLFRSSIERPGSEFYHEVEVNDSFMIKGNIEPDYWRMDK